MTHGDKKAKPAKTSQTSAEKSTRQAGTPGKERSKAVAATGTREAKGSVKAQPPGGKGVGGKASAEKTGSGKTSVAGAKSSSQKSGTEKGLRPTVTKDSAAPRVGEPKAERAAVPSGPAGFSDAGIAAAFKRALKRYPNAFRRLTD